MLPPMPEPAGGLSLMAYIGEKDKDEMTPIDWLIFILFCLGLMAYNLHIGVW